MESCSLLQRVQRDENDDKTVLSIELDDFRVTEYALDAVNNYCIAAAEDHAFIGGNLNLSSHISKVNLANGDVQSLTLSKLILDSIISDTSNLYALHGKTSMERCGQAFTFTTLISTPSHAFLLMPVATVHFGRESSTIESSFRAGRA